MVSCCLQIEYRRCCHPRCLSRKLDLQSRVVKSWLSKSREDRPVKLMQSGCDQLVSVSQEFRLAVTPAAVTPSMVDPERSGSLEKSIRRSRGIVSTFSSIGLRISIIPVDRVRCVTVPSVLSRRTSVREFATHCRMEPGSRRAEPGRTSLNLHGSIRQRLREQTRCSSSHPFVSSGSTQHRRQLNKLELGDSNEAV